VLVYHVVGIQHVASTNVQFVVGTLRQDLLIDIGRLDCSDCEFEAWHRSRRNVLWA
jgi:hypothetical protein